MSSIAVVLCAFGERDGAFRSVCLSHFLAVQCDSIPDGGVVHVSVVLACGDRLPSYLVMRQHYVGWSRRIVRSDPFACCDWSGPFPVFSCGKGKNMVSVGKSVETYCSF